MCYCHHIEMTSVIKFFVVIRFFLLQRSLGEVLCFVLFVNLALNFDTFDQTFRMFVSRSFLLGIDE